jgi:hypothetical protein
METFDSRKNSSKMMKNRLLFSSKQLLPMTNIIYIGCKDIDMLCYRAHYFSLPNDDTTKYPTFTTYL